MFPIKNLQINIYADVEKVSFFNLNLSIQLIIFNG